jgi:RimJ/RimL family protein N-acetyltransferase
MAEAELHDRALLSRVLEAAVPDDWPPPFNDEDSARYFLDYLTAHPDAVGWMMWYFVRDGGDARIVIGNGGFKGAPVDAKVEIGYSIMPAFQRHGYATEAVSALIDWAFSHEPVTRIVAETLPDLHASQALLRKLAFREVQASHPHVLRFALDRSVRKKQ